MKPEDVWRQASRWVVMAVAAFAVFSLGACFRTETGRVAGGGGVETTEGNLAAATGLPAGAPAGARVSLVPADFDPTVGPLPDSLTATADARGHYAFRRPAPGTYNLDVVHAATGARAFRAGLNLRAGQGNIPVTDSLRPPGSLRLAWEGRRAGFLYQKGGLYQRSIRAETSGTEDLILDSLPAGNLPPVYHRAFAADSLPIRISDSLAVGAGQTASLAAYGEWRHAADWVPDAGALGAGSDTALTEYPVLLRLTGGYFDFTQAAGQGQDIRFTDALGRPLTYAVERWDSASAQAALWVRAPRLGRAGSLVAGGNAGSGGTPAAQALRMYWGRPGATSHSQPPQVFDTTLGYAGVWHLGERGGVDSLRIQDATWHGLKGHWVSLTADSSATSLIGLSPHFNGRGGYAYCDDSTSMPSLGPLMISAWIKPEFTPPDTARRAVAAKWQIRDSSGYALEFAPEIQGFRFTLGLETPRRVFTLDAPNVSFASGEWHFLAVYFDGSQARLYWDGELLRQGSTGPGGLAANHRDFVIGARGDTTASMAEIQFWKGGIDEMRLYHSVRSADWMRADFQTQKPGAAFFRFAPIR